MTLDVATIYGLAGAGAVGFGLFGMLANPRPLQKVLGFNLMGGGAFVIFGAVAQRAAEPDLGADPIPHAMVITGLVVSFAATALVVSLLLRLQDLVDEARAPTSPSGGAIQPKVAGQHAEEWGSP